jgi:Long-chain fatty acid transport protein
LHPGKFRYTRSTLALIFVLSANFGFASGFALFEQDSKATAMGGAFAATADDPSAMFYNVAGIAYQRKLAATAGSTIITFNNEFKGDNHEYPGPAVTERYKAHTFTLPNVYAVVPIGENMTFGIAQYVPFGLRTNWDDATRSSARFISQDANVKSIAIQPSFAWKTSSGKFALGVGAEYRTSHISLERNQAAISPFTLRIVDVAHIRLNSDWNDAWGYTAGLMFRPNDMWSFGLSHHASMDIDYTGDATFRQLSTGNPQFDAAVARQLPPNQNIKTSIAFPAMTAFGIATNVVPGWRIEADTTYTTWSRFKSLDINFANPSTPTLHTPENWTDTWSFRLGTNHPVTERWDVRLGAVYDQNPQPVERVGPLLPDSDRVGPTFGLGFHGQHWSVDANDFFLIFMNRNTLGKNPDNFNGTYKTTANLFSFNVGYTF